VNLKAEREKRNLNQSELAKVLGMTQQSYSRIERGVRKPTKQHMQSFKMAMLLFDLGKWSELL